jgi:hypothetical protein
VGAAQADSISLNGSIWENNPTGAANAIPANVPGTTPDVTFTTIVTFTPPGIPVINFSAGTYTIGAFLSSNGMNTTVHTGASELGNTLNNTIFNFTGTVSLTQGQTYVWGADDGITLIINGVTVVSNPLSHGFSELQNTWLGGTGTFAFQMVYGECCNPPAQLFIEGLALTSPPVATPLPAALPLFAGGLGALGLLGWRRKRKAVANAI